MLLEIEKSSFALPAVVYRTPIWCFTVYEIGEPAFDWMGEGKLGRAAVKVGSVIVNNVVYTNAYNTADPMDLQRKHFCQIGNTEYTVTIRKASTHTFTPLIAEVCLEKNLIAGVREALPPVIAEVYAR